MSEDTHKSAFQQRFQIDESRFGIVRSSVDRLPIIDVGALVDGSP